jgi:predicted RNA-binding Zn ribbon-like protein
MADSSRPPAPEPLRLVQDFVNTRDVEYGTDRLADCAGLAGWLREQSLPGGGGPVTAADVRAATGLREALRALLRANAGAELDPAAVARLNSAGERAPLQLRLDARGGAALVGGGEGVEAGLGRILAAVYAAMADGSWGRLKVCRSSACEWAFYDRSRNRSGQWCEMAVCGSRHKVRAFRERHGPAAPAPGHTP